jgi:hypothetical protein
MRLSLMSTVYQLAEDVKQYEEIESAKLAQGGAYSMKIKAHKGKCSMLENAEIG